MNTALLSALHEIETDKGIPFETVKGVLEESLLAAYENREGAIEGRRRFTGTIVRTDETSFVLKLPEGGAEVELPFGSVSQANLKEDI